jgi:hypothetical protein
MDKNITMKGMITGEVLGVLLVDEVGQIASIIEDHIKGFATRESGNGLIDTPEVFFLSLALPGEDGNTRGGDAGSKCLFVFFFFDQRYTFKDLRSGGMVLGGKDVLIQEIN